jgi:hypothetical protein
MLIYSSTAGRVIEDCDDLARALNRAIKLGWRFNSPEFPENANINWVRDEIRCLKESLNILEFELNKEYL